MIAAARAVLAFVRREPRPESRAGHRCQRMRSHADDSRAIARVRATLAPFAEEVDALLGRQTIRPKQAATHKMVLTTGSRLGMIMAGISLPIALLLLSGIFWFKRRGA